MEKSLSNDIFFRDSVNKGKKCNYVLEGSIIIKRRDRLNEKS